MVEKNKHWAGLAVFGVVIFMGLGTFVLGLGTFSKRLEAPFGLSPRSSLTDASFAPDSPDAFLSQTKDTDRDGIPDVQELQVYRTSPFLEDSDSDGVSDKAEIDAGTDPNCPKGKDCRASDLPLTRDAGQKEIAKKLYESTVSSQLEKTGVPGISDPTSIRNFLRDAGVSEDTLKQFDDAALRKIFEQAATQGSVVPKTVSSSQQKNSASDIPVNPPPAAIRELLLKGGFEKTMLDKFTDEQIVKLYQDTLKDVKQ